MPLNRASDLRLIARLNRITEMVTLYLSLNPKSQHALGVRQFIGAMLQDATAWPVIRHKA